jgi:KDO2-lipid IV(A) lauroyltransferase
MSNTVTDGAPSPPRAVSAWQASAPAWRQWRRYWLRDPLLGGLDYAIHYGCRALPTSLCSAIGGHLGVLNGRFRYTNERERAERLYLALAGSQATEDEATRAVIALFGNVGRVMLEFSALDRLWAQGRIAVDGREHLLEPRAAGQPVIVMGLHLGNWETIGPTIVGLGFRGAKGFYQPPRSRFEHRLVVTARERYGAIMLPNGVTGARSAHRHLVEERGVLLVYADEERRGHVSAPLFGRELPARANILNIIRLAWASGAVVVPAYAERLGGAHFRVTYLPAIELLPDSAGALSENVGRIDRIITPLVLAHLAQWYMLLEWRN